MDAVADEARAGGDVGVAVAVDVDRLAEAEAELAVSGVAADLARDAPAGAGCRAWRRRGEGAGCDSDGDYDAECVQRAVDASGRTQREGRRTKATASSVVPSSRSQEQQPTQAWVRQLSAVTGAPRSPVPLVSTARSP